MFRRVVDNVVTLGREVEVGLEISRSDRQNRQLSWFNPAGVDAVLHEIEQIPFI